MVFIVEIVSVMLLILICYVMFSDGIYGIVVICWNVVVLVLVLKWVYMISNSISGIVVMLMVICCVVCL